MILSTLQLNNITLFVRCENGLNVPAVGANSYTPLRLRIDGNGYGSLHQFLHLEMMVHPLGSFYHSCKCLISLNCEIYHPLFILVRNKRLSVNVLLCVEWLVYFEIVRTANILPQFPLYYDAKFFGHFLSDFEGAE